jgi:hypothetical protein
MATLSEIEERWSLSDLMDANVALDVVDDLARASAEQSRKRSEAQRPPGRGRRR